MYISLPQLISELAGQRILAYCHLACHISHRKEGRKKRFIQSSSVNLPTVVQGSEERVAKSWARLLRKRGSEAARGNALSPRAPAEVPRFLCPRTEGYTRITWFKQK